MPDDFGRVNLMPHFLDRGAREEPYHGRQGRKHQSQGDDGPGEIESAEEEPTGPAAGSHVDLRI